MRVFSSVASSARYLRVFVRVCFLLLRNLLRYGKGLRSFPERPTRQRSVMLGLSATERRTRVTIPLVQCLMPPRLAPALGLRESPMEPTLPSKMAPVLIDQKPDQIPGGCRHLLYLDNPDGGSVVDIWPQLLHAGILYRPVHSPIGRRLASTERFGFRKRLVFGTEGENEGVILVSRVPIQCSLRFLRVLLPFAAQTLWWTGDGGE